MVADFCSSRKLNLSWLLAVCKFVDSKSKIAVVISSIKYSTTRILTGSLGPIALLFIDVCCHLSRRLNNLLYFFGTLNKLKYTVQIWCRCHSSCVKCDTICVRAQIQPRRVPIGPVTSFCACRFRFHP